MKRKLLFTSAVIPALLSSGAMGQVVNFHDAANGQLTFPGVGYNELYAGQGAYSDPGNDIWNGFGFDAGFQSTYFYSGGFNSGGDFPQQYGNPGNPYAAYGKGGNWTSSTGSSLFDFATGSPANTGNTTSGGVLTPITLTVGGYSGDSGIGNVGALTVPDGSPGFLLGECAVNNGGSPNEVFTLHNVPAGTYGLYLYAANYDNNRGTSFAVNSGSAHNGISGTLNGQDGKPAGGYVEGQNYVIFENVTPDGSGNITITASPNAQDGVGNSNLSGETDVNGFQLVFNPSPTAQGMTPAQNIWSGGTASFSFSPAFAASATYHWQSVIGGTTNSLSDGGIFTGTGTTNLVLTGATAANAGLYQCVITTATATNTSPAAPLTILISTATGPLHAGDSSSAVGYILQPGDTIADANNNITAPYNDIPAPFDMGVGNVEDGRLFQYVNLGPSGSVAPFSGPVTVTVTPNIGASVVTGIRFFNSNGHPEDDPADYTLEGSTDGGNTFTPIAGGLLNLPARRNAGGGAINITNQVLQEIDFANTAAYSTYQLTFTNVKSDATASNGVMIAEIQLLGSLPAAAPGIAVEPPGNEELLAGATFDPAVVASGAGPITYKWTFGSTPIPGATNAMLVITNISSTNDGDYFCTVINSFGSNNSGTVSLNVVQPTDYEKTLLGLNPLAYWPLNETSGSTAFDTVGGFNGAYNNGVTLNQPGVPAAGFGSNSVSAVFDGSSGFVDIPEGPFNITGAITVAVWANVQAHGNFAGLMGHGDSSWRTSNNGSGQPGASDGGAGDATSGTSIVDGNWHLVVYAYNGVLNTQNNGVLYVDGVEVASDQISSTPAGDNLDVWIGGAPDYGTGRLLPASIAHAAIFTYGLTSNQVQALYFASLPSPVATVPATATVNLNGTVTIDSTAVGKPPLTYQWFDVVGGVTNEISGATGSELTLTDVQQAQSADGYFVVVSNAFGASTSAVVALNILSGAPVLQADVSPLLVEVPVGVPVTFSVTATGTEPFTYLWSTDGSSVTGATNSSFTFNSVAGSNTYSVTVGNTSGSIPSATATVLGLTNPSPVIGFNGDGTGWTFNQGSGWPGAPNHPGVSNNLLTLTDGTNGEVGSAFYDIPQYIGGFIASFTYQDVGGGGADGVTFCIQNSTNAASSVNATGGGGGELGYTGISPSAALELNIYAGDHGGEGLLFATGGNTPNSDSAVGNFLNPAPVAIDSGDPLFIQLYYNGSVLSLTVVDTKSSNTYNNTFSAPDLEGSVGGASAFVGFTGATGGVNSTQTILDFAFSYTTPPILSVASGAGGSVVVSWPVSVSSAFQLQQSAALTGPWANVAGTPQVVNLENVMTITPGAAVGFFRLNLE